MCSQRSSVELILNLLLIKVTSAQRIDFEWAIPNLSCVFWEYQGD